MTSWLGIVELGPGLAGEHLDVVAELGDLAGEVAGVDALASAVRIAAIDEPGDPEGRGHEGQI